MNNVFVYCEMEGAHVADVSLELLTKGRKLATQLGCQLETICAGTDLADVEKQVLPYGVDRVHVFDAPGLFPYTSLPHTSILVNLFKEEKPQICLMGATVIGRDLGPRVSSALTSGLTADCTQLEIGNHEDKKNGITYENLLYQIRPAFGGNIVATIINPEHRPQMATVSDTVFLVFMVTDFQLRTVGSQTTCQCRRHTRTQVTTNYGSTHQTNLRFFFLEQVDKNRSMRK
jgi:electron transfer flavoprotein alpha subunit